MNGISFFGKDGERYYTNPMNKLPSIPDLCRLLHAVCQPSNIPVDEGYVRQWYFEIVQAFTHSSAVFPKKTVISLQDNPDLAGCLVREASPMVMNHGSEFYWAPQEDYECFEFGGDKMLGSAVGTYLITAYPPGSTVQEGVVANPEFYTKALSRLVETSGCSYLATTLGLAQWTILSPKSENECDRGRPGILEDMFEAFLWVIFKMYGWNVVHMFVVNMIYADPRLTDIMMYDKNFKEQLQLIYQKEYDGQTPMYKVHNKEGPEHLAVYTVGVYSPHRDGVMLAHGIGPSKKAAEQAAAEIAIQHEADWRWKAPNEEDVGNTNCNIIPV
jgi:ribonuclease III